VRKALAASRMTSAIRILSGQESLARDRCQAACARSIFSNSGSIEESGFKLFPLFSEAMSAG